MTTTDDVFLGLGGNIGDTAAVLRSAVSKLAATPGIEETQLSPLYRTSPVSDIPQRDYVNGVCRLRTSLQPGEIFRLVKDMEREMGRVETTRNAPRVLDIDILFFGTRTVREAGLDIPHPRWHERLFVLRPLADLVSHLVLADGSELDIQQILENFPHADGQKLWPLGEVDDEKRSS